MKWVKNRWVSCLKIENWELYKKAKQHATFLKKLQNKGTLETASIFIMENKNVQGFLIVNQEFFQSYIPPT